MNTWLYKTSNSLECTQLGQLSAMNYAALKLGK